MKYPNFNKIIILFLLVFPAYLSVFCSTENVTQSDAYYHYILGNLAEMTGDIKKAIVEYKISASLDADSLYLRRILANLYFLTGDTNSASQEIQYIFNKQPGDKQTAELLAETYIYQKKPEEAISTYETILATEPANKKALFNTGVLYSQLGKYEKGIFYLEKYIELEPSSSEAYTYLGIIYKKLEKLQDAELCFKKAQDVSSNSVMPLLALAEFYEEQRNYEKALEIYDRVIKNIPEYPGILVKAAGLHLANKNLSTAKEYLLKASKSSKDNPLIPYYLGLISSEQKEYNEAINYFNEAIKCDKNMPEPYSQKGYVLTAMGESKKAVKSLEKAAGLGADSSFTYFLLALNYEYLKKSGKAEYYLKKVVELEPKNIKFLFELGTVLDKQKKIKEAEEIFSRIIQIDTAAAQAYNYLGYTFADRNIKLDEAAKLINIAVGLDPGNGAYLDSLGWLYYRQKNYQQALTQLLKASTIMEDPVIFDHLGDCYLVLGDTQMAVDSWESSYNLENNSDIKSKIKKYGKNLVWKSENIKMRALRNFISISDMSGFVNAVTIFQKKEYETDGALFFKKPDNLRFEILMPFSIKQDFILIKGTTTHYITQDMDNVSDQLSENLLWINDFFSIFCEQFFGNLSFTGRDGGTLVFANDNITLKISDKGHIATKIIFKNGTLINFYDYKQAGRIKFPRKICIDNKEKNIHASVFFKNFNINTNLKDDLFNVPERGNKQ